MPRTEFDCTVCKEHVVHEDKFTTGYGIDKDDNKICYSCCGQLDRRAMIDTGKAVLYLNTETKKISNWPGSLEFRAYYIKTGRHNKAGRRYDAWFKGPDGFIWHGVQYGDNNEIIRCQRTRERIETAKEVYYIIQSLNEPIYNMFLLKHGPDDYIWGTDRNDPHIAVFVQKEDAKRVIAFVGRTEREWLKTENRRRKRVNHMHVKDLFSSHAKVVRVENEKE